MHHESEWGPRPERECGDEVHILGKKMEPVWPFLDGLLLSRGSRCDMTRSIKEMGQQIFLSLLNHWLVNAIPKSLSSGQKLIGHILSRNLLINIILM